MKRKCGVVLAVLALVMMFWAFNAQAYTIGDPSNDSIGYPVYESYGINVYNFTPGSYTGNITLDLFTNFPQAGETVNGSPPWTTVPADIFITESYKNPLDPNAVRQNYQWAVPLVTHDGFTAGTMYAVGSSYDSNHFDPSNGTGYIYNHNVPVQIATGANNYGWTSIGGGSVDWIAQAAPGHPDWMVRVVLGLYEDDPNGTFSFLWGTATCANDIVCGQVPQVPIPPSMFLLGTGLVGIGLLRFRRRQLTA
jgi:hypothetical protein